MVREFLSRQPLAANASAAAGEDVYKALDEVRTLSGLGALVTRIVGEPPR